MGSRQNRCEGVTVGRRAARGGAGEVTELDPKSSTLLPMWSVSIMEAFLTSSTSRNSLEQRFHRCEQTVHTPSRHHHACAVRRVRRRPGRGPVGPAARSSDTGGVGEVGVDTDCSVSSTCHRAAARRLPGLRLFLE